MTASRAVAPSIAAVRAAEDALHKARIAYLKAQGWSERKTRHAGPRWVKAFPWGAASERLFEADLLDAVNLQARVDELEAGESEEGDAG